MEDHPLFYLKMIMNLQTSHKGTIKELTSLKHSNKRQLKAKTILILTEVIRKAISRKEKKGTKGEEMTIVTLSNNHRSNIELKIEGLMIK